MMIYAVLEAPGFYETTKQIVVNGETKYFRIIADKFSSNSAITKGTFIDISDITPIVEARLKAESAVVAKNNFLANTSHEIRTPMNAILGLSELALREDLQGHAREYLINIRQAGTNLLAIINDILDFSKIESGKIEITPSNYMLSSLINDCINIIRIRLAEKPILFIANIDSRLPNQIVGDEVRVRQIILNLLSNAVKYTHEGHIIFSVMGESVNVNTEKQKKAKRFPPENTEYAVGNQLHLTISVADTGIGIKESDIEQLFGEFVQVDTHKNRGVEGTGLGLAISRSLCRTMGGDITVASRYGEGSIFTAVIPQLVAGKSVLASVENPEKKPVLLFEPRTHYANSIVYALESLQVPVKAVNNLNDFTAEIDNSESKNQPYAFAMVSSKYVEQTHDLFQQKKCATTPVFLADLGEISSSKKSIITMPAYTLSLANVLNGVVEIETHEEKTSVRFIAPTAHLLIVDDIMINLDVAKGLLSLYEPVIDICTGGRDAIERIKKQPYDIVLMDHMMPDMDGIETTEAIRQLDLDYAKTIPIVALTANAVSGMKEMFLSKGFNDYLAKPIEITKLDDMMEKWIPNEKKIKTLKKIKLDFNGDTQLVIEGIDVQKGISMTGGIESGYRTVLKSFYKDAVARISYFADTPEKSDIKTITIQAHALKSASATIGAEELSQEAAQLETAGKAEDLARIKEILPSFYTNLTHITERIDAALSQTEQSNAHAPKTKRIKPSTISQLADLQTALAEKKIKDIDRLIAELEQLPLDEKIKESVTEISDFVLMSEYDEAANLLQKMLKKN
jgi:signal transduction histidine kinase/CheY-like chemotaxis protein